MKKYLLLLVSASLSALLSAQTRDSVNLHWTITSKPTEFIFGNIPITVEKVFKHRTLGVTLAYRPSYKSGGETGSISAGLGGDYENQYVVNKIVQGVYLSVNSKNYVFGDESNFYLDPEIFYRRWWCNDKQESFDNVEGYRFNATRTESVNVYGLKMLIGHSFIFRKTRSTKIVLDTYAGLGMRYKTWDFVSKDGTVYNQYYTTRTDKGTTVLPSLHLGVNFGVGL